MGGELAVERRNTISSYLEGGTCKRKLWGGGGVGGGGGGVGGLCGGGCGGVGSKIYEKKNGYYDKKKELRT